MNSLTKPLEIKCFLRFNFAITTICASIRLGQMESTVLTDLINVFVQKIRHMKNQIIKHQVQKKLKQLGL